MSAPPRGPLPSPRQRPLPPLRLLLLAAMLPLCPGLNVCTRGSASSCEECLLLHPHCAWCSKEDYGGPQSELPRCDLRENLARGGCGGELEGPHTSVHVLQDDPLSTRASGHALDQLTQINPQRIAVDLRPGEAARVRVQVRPVEDYPLDLYYLMDLSLSMKDDLDAIRHLGTRLAQEMRALTRNFRLGFGSFVDKSTSPFSYTAPRYRDNPCVGYKLFPSCVPAFGFRHLLALTDEVGRFNEEVQKQRVSRNRDAPEGGFDAILQAAVCTDKVGWRKEALHLLVFTTDDVPHIALDGKLGGLVQPHDGLCHLDQANEYSATNQMDYPSLALLGEKLAENNIHLIFAVTKNHYMLYKNFTALIPGTTVEILHGDSRNIIQLIVNAYNGIRSKVELEAWDVPEDLDLTYTAICQDGVAQPGQRKCRDLKIGDTVAFEVSLEARGCPGPGSPDRRLALKPVGFRDTLELLVTYNCSCACSAHAEPDSARCSRGGTYSCGACACGPGRLGARCQCREGEGEEGGEAPQAPCREAEGRPLCSGRGECVCQRCLCYHSDFGRIYGPFCQCDDFSCARSRGLLCSGHGDCHCGECQCHAGFVGDNCNCTTETETCVSGDGQLCSGRGHCVCGQCQCTEPGAFGDTCERCPTCPDACGTKRGCVECLLQLPPSGSDRAPANETCQKQCRDAVVTRVDTVRLDVPDTVTCFFKTAQDCVVTFAYSEVPGGKSTLTVLKEPDCGSAPSTLTILLAVGGSVLLVGLVLLAIWKMLVTIHDRREFARFQSERARARYEMATNPLYRKPVSTHRVEWTFGKLSRGHNGTVD
uniref:Integrin beta n=2 Tax=Ornithorhynchus anatinus TaxID=9258 RepID=A0A6I8N8I1_ORNAN